MFDKAKIVRLKNLCKHTRDPVSARLADIHAIEYKLANLKETCNGRISWRDGNKIIILHSVNRACPLHGQPVPGQRLRSYIGTDPGKQAQASQAIEDEKKRERLQREHDRLASALQDATSALRKFYRILDYAPKEDP